jgi:hypothetical protein
MSGDVSLGELAQLTNRTDVMADVRDVYGLLARIRQHAGTATTTSRPAVDTSPRRRAGVHHHRQPSHTRDKQSMDINTPRGTFRRNDPVYRMVD